MKGAMLLSSLQPMCEGSQAPEPIDTMREKQWNPRYLSQRMAMKGNHGVFRKYGFHMAPHVYLLVRIRLYVISEYDLLCITVQRD